MLAAMMLFSAVAAQGPCTAEAGVHHDASARTLVLRTAARDLPAPTGAGQYGSHHGHGKVSPLARFAWPADGWARGFRVRILDCAGTELGRVPRLHHALVLHLSRRELLYPVTARLMAIGQETDDVILPRGVGLRLAAGDSLGFLVSWGAGEQGPERVMLEVTIPYLPARANPRPTDVIPFGFDVRYAPETGNAFDLPPGRSEHTREFVMPIDGHVLAAGGHLHDYAVSLELIDTESGRAAMTIRARRSPDGRILGVERQVYGASGAGVRLRAGRQYRLVATYDNPTGRTLPGAGMGLFAGLFAPVPGTAVPTLDRSAPGYQQDIVSMTRQGFLPGAPAASHARGPERL